MFMRLWARFHAWVFRKDTNATTVVVARIQTRLNI